MKIERTKNATRNIAFGGLLKVYQIIVPFLMRTVMIYFMGVEYLGLNSLFTSILQVLNLAELGVGSAMVYSMYRPIAEDNKEEICALMRLYRSYYRVIGLVIAVLGVILLPFIPQLINGEVPSGINVYILYLLNLCATVLSYWLFAYKNCLLLAHQRVDVTSKVTLFANTIQYFLQFAVLYFLRDYYIYVIVALFTQVLNNVVTAVVVTKQYPEYRPKGKLTIENTKNINQRIRDLFTSKVGGVIVNSADTIVISTFLGLRMLAIYQNYFYILTSILGFVAIIFNACTAGIGNSIIVETKEKNYQDLKKLTFLIAWIAGFCAASLLCLYQPFMDIWVGPDLKLEFSVVVCLCVYYFVYEINQIFLNYKDAAGIWHQDRFRPLVTALANLVMNLIMVRYLGIYGIILSTVLSTTCIGMPWLLHNLFTSLFEKSQLWDYLKQLAFYVCMSVLAGVVTFIACSFVRLEGWLEFFVKLLICVAIPNAIFVVVYHRRMEFKECVLLLDRITKGKLFFLKALLR